MKELGIGIVGYGAIARVHTAALQLLPLMYPTAAYRPIIRAITPGGAASQQRAAHDAPSIPQRTYEHLLADPAIAAVLISTPTGQHAAHVRQALQAGKHVFCEKPLVVDPMIAQQLVEIAAAAGLQLVMNHHFRRVPALLEAQRRIAAGNLGQGLRAYLRYYRSSNVSPSRPVSWRFAGDAGGVLVDLGSHLIDLTHAVFGSPFVAVQAQLTTVYPQRPDAAGVLQPVTVDDIAWLHGQLADGMHVTIEASKVVPGAADSIRVEAYGTQASIVFDTASVNTLTVGDAAHPLRMTTVDVWNTASPQPTIPGPETPTGSLSWHAASWEAFLACVAGQERTVCRGAAAVHVDAVIAAARRSHAHNGAWEPV